MTSHESDLIQYSLLETKLLDLVRLANTLAKAKDDAEAKAEDVERKNKEWQAEVERMRKAKVEEKESLALQERRAFEEKLQLAAECERLRIANAETNAAIKALQGENEQLARNTGNAGAAIGSAAESTLSTSATKAASTLSHMLAREVIDQLSIFGESLKEIERKCTMLQANVILADAKAAESAGAVDKANDLVDRAKERVQILQAANHDLSARSRMDASKISSLKLDVETLQEHVQSLGQQVSVGHRARLTLETEMEKSKIAVATTLMTLSSEAFRAIPPAGTAPSSIAPEYVESVKKFHVMAQEPINQEIETIAMVPSPSTTTALAFSSSSSHANAREHAEIVSEGSTDVVIYESMDVL